MYTETVANDAVVEGETNDDEEEAVTDCGNAFLAWINKYMNINKKKKLLKNTHTNAHWGDSPNYLKQW